MNSTYSKTSRLASISTMMLSGQAGSTNKRVLQAMAWLDGERITSVPGILGAYRAKAEAVHADRELSDEGKRARVRAAADSTLGNIATLAKKLVTLEQEHKIDVSTAVPIPKAEAADVILDLALVAHVKAAEPIPTALLNMSERVRLAVARTPPELAGIKGDLQSRVRGSLMSPDKAAQIGDEAEALGAARRVVQEAVNELASDARWEPREWVQQFGAHSGFKLPGVIDSLARRLAGEPALADGGGE